MDQTNLSKYVCQRAKTNLEIVDKWWYGLVLAIQNEFKRNQVIDTSFYGVYMLRPDHFHYTKVSPGNNDKHGQMFYEKIISENFAHGAPFFACSFVTVFEHDYLDEIKDEYITSDLLLITLETPLSCVRTIYEIKEVNNRKILYSSEDLSAHLKMPGAVNRFNHIIQPTINTVN